MSIVSPSRPAPSPLAAAAVAGPVTFTLLLAIIDASKARWLSDAGQGILRHSPMSVNSHGPHGWAMIVNFALFGVLTLALALLLRRTLPVGRARTSAVAAVSALALGSFLACFRCDTELFGKQPPTTWNGDIHFVGFSLLLSTQPFIALALWRALRRDEATREWARGFAIAALIGIPIYVLFALTQPGWSWWYAWFGVFQLAPLQAIALRFGAASARLPRPARTIAIAASLGAVTLASAAVASAATTTLRLVEHETFSHPVAGGQTFGGTVYDRRRHRVGHDRITCTKAGCRVVEWLQGGSLRGSFPHGGRRFTVKITAGTGIYAGAHGTATVITSPGTNRYTIQLTR